MFVFEGINWIAVIAAGLLYFGLGALWYSPLLFSKPFLRFRGGMEAIQNGHPAEYGLVFVADLVSALVLTLIINVANPANALEGALVGVIVGAGIAAASAFVFTVFSGPHKGLWLIYTGYQLVAFTLMGVLLTLWV